MIAGIRYGMQATGFEISEEYFNLAKIRLENEIVQQNGKLQLC